MTYSVTAPRTFVSGGQNLCFKEWLRDGTSLGNNLTVTGTTSGQLVASYGPLRTLDIRTVHPTTNVAYTCTPAACDGSTSGTAPRVPQFVEGTQVLVLDPAANRLNLIVSNYLRISSGL